MKKKWIISLLIALLAMIVFLLWNSQQNRPAPAFSLPEIHSQTMISEKNFIGKTTLLNFWYPSCPGCVEEMPKLMALQKKHPHLQIIGISLNVNTEEEVKHFIQQHGISFQVAYDKNSEAKNAYEIQFTPSTYLIDRQGNMLRYYIGEPDWQEVEQHLNKQ